METEHRERILNNIEALVRETNYNKLMNECLNVGLLSDQMCKNIEKYQPTNDAELKICHRKLFEKLTHRGPDAYEKLMTILALLQAPNAVRILSSRYEEGFVSIANKPYAPTTSTSTSSDGCISSKLDSEEPMKLEEYNGKITNNFNVRKASKICVDEKTGVYPMKSKNDRGVLFLVNIIEFHGESPRRNGAHNDSAALIEVFTKIGFKIFSYTNCSLKQFFDLLDQLLKSDYTRRTECFMLVLMSHGSKTDDVEYVEFNDGAVSKVTDIEERFTNFNCPNLRQKPKILIFPFCRGKGVDTGIPVETDSVNTNTKKIAKPMPTMADVLICHATHKGFESHRSPERGSWYIQDLCKLLAENAHDTNFETIIKMVQNEVDKKYSDKGGVQTPTMLNVGFRKHLYLNPGQWETEQ